MSISEHKHMPEPVRRMEVFTGADRRRIHGRAAAQNTLLSAPVRYFRSR